MRKFLSLALMALLTMPLLLRAEEREIPLMEVVTMNPLPGDNPLDGPEQSGNNPTRPTNFRATIDGQNLIVTKLESSIPSAQVVVVNAITGNVILNEQFSTSVQEQIATYGTYVLRIETNNVTLVGQFIV